MADFLLVARTPLDPPPAMAALFDLAAHTAVIPFTTLRHDGSPLRTGSEFTARTALGPFGFDDRMRVLDWSPPGPARTGRVLIVKTGPLLRGRIEALIRPAPSGAEIQWRQELQVRWLPRLLDPFVALVGAAAYGIAIRQILGRATRRTIAA